MHTVIETPAYLSSARDVGLSDAERDEIVGYLARHPDAGDLIPGTGGARKLRFAGRSKGKSGGYRVISFFAADDIPVFLLDIYGKGARADLSQAAKNELRKMLTALPQAWRAHRATRTSRTK